jgi:hypothetical protein
MGKWFGDHFSGHRELRIGAGLNGRKVGVGVLRIGIEILSVLRLIGVTILTSAGIPTVRPI